MTDQDQLAPYAAILLVISLIGGLATVMLLLAHLVRPAKKGSVKDSTYESGMPAIGDARKRFNVRFYIVAMLFLLFDVEVVFLWPWAPIFYKAATTGSPIVTPGWVSADSTFLLGAMSVFASFLVIGFIYEWRRGMFQWQ